MLYGATGSLVLTEIATSFDPENALDLCGAGLVLVGLAFKISSVPFHQWAPDAYEGAPTTVSGFMATAVKVAAFGALVRVVSVGLAPASDALARRALAARRALHVDRQRHGADPAQHQAHARVLVDRARGLPA